jgi:hypothetical protein
MKDITKIVGVKFNNPDGESRQEILKSFGENTYLTVNLLKETWLNPETNIPELAIACVERNSKKKLGYIARAEVSPELLKLRQLTGLISFCKDTYYCELAIQQLPDKEMYESMKKICADRNLPMPAYDIRAYIQFSENLNGKPVLPETYDDNDYPF